MPRVTRSSSGYNDILDLTQTSSPYFLLWTEFQFGNQSLPEWLRDTQFQSDTISSSRVDPSQSKPIHARHSPGNCFDPMVGMSPMVAQAEWRRGLMSHAWGRRLPFLHVASITNGSHFFSIRDLSYAGVQAQNTAESLLSEVYSSLYQAIASQFPAGWAAPLGIWAKGTLSTFPGCCVELVISHRMEVREFLWLSLVGEPWLVPTAVKAVSASPRGEWDGRGRNYLN